jgi:hypothetical protein
MLVKLPALARGHVVKPAPMLDDGPDKDGGYCNKAKQKIDDIRKGIIVHSSPSQILHFSRYHVIA